MKRGDQNNIAGNAVRDDMAICSVPHALEKAEEWLKKDHARVTNLLALKGAQVKYVLNKVGEIPSEETQHEWKKLHPPFHDEDALVQYGMNTYEDFTQHLRPRMERVYGISPEWLNELENAFLEMRRIVMQSLSKHPALRPYNALTSLHQKMNECTELEVERERIRREMERLLHVEKQTNLELHDLLVDPSYDTLQRLNHTREKLSAEKQVLNDLWLSTWGELANVFKRLVEHPSSEKWENAQHRMVHLYLSNTLNTRDKDPHGKGLAMIIQLAVNALEKEKKLFKDLRNEEVREILLHALENPLFVNFQEHYHALDAALGQNQQERLHHPAYKRQAALEHALAKTRIEQGRAEEALKQAEQSLDERKSQLEKDWAEANRMCQLNLGIELEKIPL